MSKTKLSNQAYRTIKDNIMSLTFEPGSILYELQLSRDLSISRTPIRSALQKLSSEGLVQIKRGQKNYFYVSELSIKTFRDIYQLRNALEILSIDLAILNIDEKKLHSLETILVEQESLIENDAPLKELLDVDRRFHKEIVLITENQLLISELDSLIDLYYRYNYFALESCNRLKQAIPEHRSIIEAMTSNNLGTARQLMNLHLSRSNENILFELAKKMIDSQSEC